jgi:hypothetical protein
MSELYLTFERSAGDMEDACRERRGLIEDRKQTRRIAHEALRRQFRNLPLGWLHFSPEWLAHREATYVRIDLGGTETSLAIDEPLSSTRIGFYERSGKRFAVDLDRDNDLGVVSEDSFRDLRSNRPEWMTDANHPNYRRVWQDLSQHGPDNRRSVLLALSGPLLAHRAIAGMASFATRILEGDQPETATVDSLNREIERVGKAVATLEARVRSETARYMATWNLEQQFPSLINAIASFDWTSETIRDPDRRTLEIRHAIIEHLNELSLDNATALLIQYAGHDWEQMLRCLDRHPDLPDEAV